MKPEDLRRDVALPVMRGLTREFYEWCHQGEIRFQRCRTCAAWRHPPRPMCGACQSWEWDWAPTQGYGEVHCFTIVHQALDRRFVGDVPYAACVLALDEGPRLASWVTDIPVEEIRVGMRVEVWFDKVSDEVTLPKFRHSSRTPPA